MQALQTRPHHHHPKHNTISSFHRQHRHQRQRRGSLRHAQPLQHSDIAAAPSGAELAVWDVVEYAAGQQEQQLRLGLVQQVSSV
jgi:hypothetical protein